MEGHRTLIRGSIRLFKEDRLVSIINLGTSVTYSTTYRIGPLRVKYWNYCDCYNILRNFLTVFVMVQV